MSHGPMVLRHPMVHQCGHVHQRSESAAIQGKKKQKLRLGCWESPHCTSSCPAVFKLTDKNAWASSDHSTQLLILWTPLLPMKVNSGLERGSLASHGMSRPSGTWNLFLAKREVSKVIDVIADVRGGTYEQIRRGDVAGTLWKASFEARMTWLGVIKSWKYGFLRQEAQVRTNGLEEIMWWK